MNAGSTHDLRFTARPKTSGLTKTLRVLTANKKKMYELQWKENIEWKAPWIFKDWSLITGRIMGERSSFTPTKRGVCGKTLR